MVQNSYETAENSDPKKNLLPLYDNLTRKVNEKFQHGNISINSEYREKLWKIMTSTKNLDQLRHISLILIHCAFQDERSKSTLSNLKSLSPNQNELPYGIKISSSGQGFSFELNQIPTSVLAILGTYCGL